MGRGRAKAKQTKVARELKYSSGSLDPEALKRELAASNAVGGGSTASKHDDDEYEDDDKH